MLNIYSQKDCSICFNTLQDDTTCITNCNHEFCIDCIDKWVNKNKTYCPLCRQQLKEYYCNNHKTKIIVIFQIKDFIMYLLMFFKKIFFIFFTKQHRGRSKINQ